MSARAIELDEAATWPDDARRRAEAITATSDGAWSWFLPSLAEQPVRLYHATRLTDAEQRAVRADGLQVASTELVRARIDAAGREAVLEPASRALLLSGHLADEADRSHRIWFCASRATVRDPATDWLGPFFNQWGGQAVWQPHAADQREPLRRIGRPVLVVARIRADHIAEAPGIGQVLFAASRARAGAHAAATVTDDVPAEMLDDLLCSPDLTVELGDDPLRWPSIRRPDPRG